MGVIKSMIFAPLRFNSQCVGLNLSHLLNGLSTDLKQIDEGYFFILSYFSCALSPVFEISDKFVVDEFPSC